jgi:TonB family protein
MKHLTSLLLVVLLAHGSINAQQTPDWIKIAPAGERFQVLMPQQPGVESAEVRYSSKDGPLTASGTAYSTSFEDSTFTLWSLEMLRTPLDRIDEISDYLDEYAELVWESLLKPARDALPKVPGTMARMSYKSELSMGAIPGREYTLILGQSFGATRIYLDGSRLYVLLAVNHGRSSMPSTNFLTGFRAKSPTETPFLPLPAATPDADSFTQVYPPKETTTKARVLAKPEPQYTEAARKYGVTGTVVLRGVFSTDGRLTNIQILKRLPHGLTQASLAAAKQIRFAPAVKDGLPVSQSIQLEYNFHLY